jgi:uncharacterized protein YjbI with pentapeptide repeats
MELVDLLEKEDVSTFNAQRGERSRPDLFAADLGGKNLAGVDLSNANADKSDFTGSDLSRASLVRALMNEIDGSGMILREAIGLKVKLRGAYLDKADLYGADFTRGDLAEAVLAGANADQARFTRARMREVDGKGAVFTDADFSEASLHKADLTDADLRRADVTEMKAAEAIFVGARLDGITGQDVRLMSANLQKVSLVGARLPGANLTGADLTGADLTAIDLTGANLTGATLTGARLSGACLANACLDDVDLSGLDLADVDLSGLDPALIGLTEEQAASLARSGVLWDPDAPLRFVGVQAARAGDRVGIMWENEDQDDLASLRWAVLGDGGILESGVVQVPTDSVLAMTVIGRADGVDGLVLRERAGGVTAVRLRLGGGESPRTGLLGYPPAVKPVGRAIDGVLHIWGIGRRGPTLVVQKWTDEGLVPVFSKSVPTARGFLGRHHPVLANKGDVVVPVGPRGPGRPLRTPSGFPGKMSTASPQGESHVWCVWVERQVGDVPGGMRVACLGGRGQAEVEALTQHDLVRSLDSVEWEDGVEIAWIERRPMGCLLFRSRLGDAAREVSMVQVEMLDAAEVTFAPAAEGPPWLVVTTDADAVVVLDHEDTVRADTR